MTSSLESVALPVDFEDAAVEVKDFSMVLACSNNSFIDGPSIDPSSSFTFELVDDESSPSTFWILGFVGDASPRSFG